MTRREFLKSCAGLCAAAGTYLLLDRPGRVFAQTAPAAKPFPDLVAVRGGAPEAMFDRAMKSLGGMGRFVKKGQTVLLKPNMSFSTSTESGANTDPRLLQRVIEHCITAGAAKVFFLDNYLFYNSQEKNGLRRAGEEAGAVFVPAASESYYQAREIPGAKVLRKTKIHETVLEADVLINIPVLKHHSGTAVSAGLKNLMGLVWDRGFFHSNGLEQCIADFPLLRPPDLTVIDAYRVIKTGGPGGYWNARADVEKMQIVSPDVVAADAAAVAQAASWGISGADRIRYVKLAADHGIGNMRLADLAIERIAL